MTSRRHFNVNEESEYAAFANKYGLERPPKDVNGVIKYFEALKDGVERGELLAVEFAARIAYNACRQDVWKEHSAAKFIEHFVARFLGGVLTSPKKRPTVSIPEIPRTVRTNLPDIRDFERGVKRAALEKPDLYFPRTGLRLSLKSLIPENQEVNVGSFPQRLLFAGLLTTIPNERKGLGSPERLLKVFKEIQERNLWNVFTERFKYMVDAIFNNVHYLIVERDPAPEIRVYIIKSDDFKGLLKAALESGPQDLVKVWYRYELHSLRLKKDPLIAKGVKIKIDLTRAESPLLKYVIDLERLYVGKLLGRMQFEDFEKNVEALTRKFLLAVKERGV